MGLMMRQFGDCLGMEEIRWVSKQGNSVLRDSRELHQMTYGICDRWILAKNSINIADLSVHAG